MKEHQVEANERTKKHFTHAQCMTLNQPKILSTREANHTYHKETLGITSSPDQSNPSPIGKGPANVNIFQQHQVQRL